MVDWCQETLILALAEPCAVDGVPGLGDGASAGSFSCQSWRGPSARRPSGVSSVPRLAER